MSEPQPLRVTARDGRIYIVVPQGPSLRVPPGSAWRMGWALIRLAMAVKMRMG